VAQRKHGSVEQLEQLRQERTETRLSRRAIKRRLESLEEERLEAVGVGDSSAAPQCAPQSAIHRQVRNRLEEEYSAQAEERAQEPVGDHTSEKDSRELEIEEF